MCGFVSEDQSLAAMLLNPDTRPKDCCAITGMRADAMLRVCLYTLQIAVLVGLLLLVQPVLLPKPKLTRDQGLISQSTVFVVTH